MRNARYDVIVVGARCAGSSLARLLARAGISVLVIDRASFPSDTVSTHSIAYPGTALLERWGLLDAVRATGVPNPRTLGVRLGTFETDVAHHPDSHGSLAPRRTVLDALLVDAAREAGAEVWEATSVEQLLWSPKGAVHGVVCRREDGRMEVVAAPLVVGADGANSTVARLCGAAAYAQRESRVSGVYAYYADTELRHPHVAMDDSGYLAYTFETNDGLTCVAACTRTERLRALVGGGDAGVQDVLRRAAPRLADVVAGSRRVSPLVTFRGVPGRFMQVAGDGWTLVGDAGHYGDPAAGQGISNAFIAAELASTAIADGLGGAVPMRDALARYQRQRDGLTTQMHDITHEMASLTWTNAQLPALFGRYRAALEDLLGRTKALGLSAAPAA